MQILKSLSKQAVPVPRVPALRVVALGVVALGVGLFPMSPVGAQATACLLGPALTPAQVTISQPGPAATVTGDLVVSGTANSSLALDRVELFVDGSLVASQQPVPADDVSFSFRVARDDLPRGEVNLRVRACNTFTLGAAGGFADRAVVIADPAPVTTSPSSTSPSSPNPSTSPAPGATATTVVAPATSVQDLPARDLPAQDRPDQERPVLVQPLPVDTDPPGPGPAVEPDGSPAPSRPLVLSDPDADPTDNGPLWVGLVVGLSGAAGLVVSAVRRRSVPGPVPAPSEAAPEDFFGDVEPVDGDVFDEDYAERGDLERGAFERDVFELR